MQPRPPSVLCFEPELGLARRGLSLRSGGAPNLSRTTRLFPGHDYLVHDWYHMRFNRLRSDARNRTPSRRLLLELNTPAVASLQVFGTFVVVIKFE